MVVATVFALAVAAAIIVVVAYGLFEMTPFAHHKDVFRKPGERQQSPRLD